MKNETRLMKRVLSVALALLMVFSMMPQITIGAKAAGETKTVYVGVIEYITDHVPTLHYWNNSTGLAGDATLAANGDTFNAAVGSAYWNNAAQKFKVYTAEIPGAAVAMKTWDKSSNGKWAAEEISYNENQILLLFEYGGTYHNVTTAYDTCFKVAGTLNGSNWAIFDEMSDTGNSVWTYTYSDVAVGEYEFKITRNGSWWPGDNQKVTVTEAGSTVTITFNASTKEVATSVVAPVKEYTVNISLTNLTKTAGADKATEGEGYTASFSANDGYTLPETIEVKVGETVIDNYTYADGTVTIPAEAVTGDITITAAGVEVKTTKTVYFQNNWKWTDVRVYTFDSATREHIGTAWPGAAMNFLENDGTYDIYSAEIPAGTTGMIFNGIKNDGSGTLDQSPDITDIQVAPMCYYMDWKEGNAVGTFEYQSNPGGGNEGGEDDTPTEVTYIVAGTAGLCGTAWDVANTDNKMTLGEDGLYSITYENVAAGTHSFKVTDGSWNNCWGGTGTDGNYEITLNAISNVTITFNAETKAIKVEHKAAESEGGDGGGETTQITVYCVNSAAWDTLAAHAWIEGGAGTAWPGKAMTKTEETVNGFDVYSVTFDTTYENIIFNNNGNGSQTANLTLQNGKYYDVKSAAWYDSLADVPGIDPLATDSYLVGSFNEWSKVANEFKLSAEGESVGYVSMELEANTTYEFKIVKSGAWTGCATTITATTSDLAFLSSVADNAKITTGAAGAYTFAYSVSDGKLSVTYPSAGGEGEGDETEKVTYTAIFHFANTIGWSPVNLYVWNNGGATTGGWPGSAMTKQDDNGYHTMTVSWDAASNTGLNYIFNRVDEQTVDLKLDASAFDAETNTAEIWVELNSTAGEEGKYTTKQVSDKPLENVLLAVSPRISDDSVTFEYINSSATSVEVRGTVPGATWDSGIAMTKNDKGIWTVTVENLEPAIYKYKFVVDGTDWYGDPANGKTDPEGNSIFTITDPNAVDTNTVNVYVFYEREDGIYVQENADGEATGIWNAHVWGNGFKNGRYDYEPDTNDVDGDGNKTEMVATIEVVGRETQGLSLKNRMSTETKEWLREEGQVDVPLDNIVSGTVFVYVKSDGAGGNKGNTSYSVVYGTDIVTNNKITDVSYNYDNGTVIVTMQEALDDAAKLGIINTSDSEIKIESVKASNKTYTLTLNKTLDLVNLYQYKITFGGYEYDIAIDAVYASDKFAKEFTYEDDDLGAAYTASATTFKVWAPTASAVSVNLYTSGTAGTEDLIKAVEMTKGENGVWAVTVDGNLNGTYYTYAVTVDGETVEAVDPYARTTGVNGNRGMVIDLDSTDPTGWADDKNPNPITSYTDAVIYELHVRDFSNHASSGMTNKGKYLAFTEEGTTTSGGVSTGIDYLDDLGITHLHLLPVYDYGSVDESKLNTPQFNWGYDPVNYNVPEGSYSTDPYDGAKRVSEFKQMVKSLHDHDISIIMDVVYNHVYNADKFCFNNIVPGYFSRVNSNRSGCGNDTASEREMVRKYIVESVLYWHQEYHIDGFRFDLVGLLDIETINQIVAEVHDCCPDVIFYGEGWNMDDTNKEPGTEMAKQGNASKTPGFGYFSDSMRNLLGGNNGNSTGFASGAVGQEGALISNFMANPGWTTNPEQVIQYASCHDNYTLVDKLIISTGANSVTDDIIKMNNLAAAVYMTAQGVPFIHAGEEFLREKREEDGGRSENSYNASDDVNNIVWSNLEKDTYKANSAYYKGLIAFRQAHPALRYETSAEVTANVRNRVASGNVVAFQIDGNGAEDDDIFVIFNANAAAQTVNLPDGDWTVYINGTSAGTTSLGTASGSVSVAGISAMVLTKADVGKDAADPTEAKTIYFSNNKHWDKVNAYVWDGKGTELNGTWPGSEMTYVETNDYGEKIYSIDLPASETGINVIFNSGSEQTVDIIPGIDGIGYYCTDKNDEGKYGAGTYTYRAPYLGTADEYFLVGYINNADYVGGNYEFDEDGKVTVEFASDSYVYVINGDSSECYMTNGWLGAVTSAMLYDTQFWGEYITADKLLIPGGVKVTITMELGSEDTITLSYEIDSSDAFKDNSGIQDGVTLHCWNWSFKEIEKNMAAIAAQGYTAIQTSPVQAMKEDTVGKTVGSHWWVYYQPVDFKITTDDGNALGTKSELESMIKTAHEYDIKVIVDVVANHLGNKTGNDLADAIPEYLRKDGYWHDIKTNITSWEDRYNMTQYCLDGLPDLNTANKEIQGYVLNFLKECVDIGVDGFRFDMAKSIETPSDGASFASDFWPTVVGGIQEYAGNKLYIYGEILDEAKIAISAYTEYMSVTDNSWGNDLRGKVSSGTAAISEGYNKAADASNLVIWAESHDTYATDDKAQNSAGVSEANINKTWALVAAREGAMGLYLARPESMDQALGTASATGWDNPEVKAVNEFHKAFVGQGETVGNSGNISYVVRGTTGIVMVNAEGTTADVSISVRMDDGKYVDHITGNTFIVENGDISGQIGDTGIAVVSQNPYMDLNTSNMTLENSLAMNFWVYPSDLREGVVYTAELTRSYANGKDDDNRTIAMKDWTPVDADSDNVVDYYQIPYSGLAAKEMNDEIVIKIKDENGNVVGEFNDSVRAYAEYMIKTYAENENYAEFVTSMVDMLNYGAAAQAEFGYAETTLANAGIADYQHLATKEIPELKDAWEGNGIGYGSNLELKENIILHIWFKNAGVESAKITYKDHYGTPKSIVLNKGDFQTRLAGISSVAVDTLVVADGAQEITCTFYGQANAQGEPMGVTTESVESYLSYMLGKNTKSNDLYIAIAKFIDSSYKSFH